MVTLSLWTAQIDPSKERASNTNCLIHQWISFCPQRFVFVEQLSQPWMEGIIIGIKVVSVSMALVFDSVILQSVALKQSRQPNDELHCQKMHKNIAVRHWLLCGAIMQEACEDVILVFVPSSQKLRADMIVPLVGCQCPTVRTWANAVATIHVILLTICIRPRLCVKQNIENLVKNPFQCMYGSHDTEKGSCPNIQIGKCDLCQKSTSWRFETSKTKAFASQKYSFVKRCVSPKEKIEALTSASDRKNSSTFTKRKKYFWRSLRWIWPHLTTQTANDPLFPAPREGKPKLAPWRRAVGGF